MRTSMKTFCTTMLLSLAIWGCGAESAVVVKEPRPIASIVLEVSSDAELTSAGDSRTVVATASDVDGEVRSASDLVWSSSEPSVATITANGSAATVTAVSDGTTLITASSGTARATVTIRVRRKLVSIEYARGDSVMTIGQHLQLLVVGRDARGHPINNPTGVTYASDNRGSIIVSPDGDITTLYTAHGTFTARVSSTVTRDGVSFSCSRLFSVLSPIPPVYDFISYMIPQSVLPEPVDEVGEALVFFRREGNTIAYGWFWSYLSGSPVSAHLHISPDSDVASDVLADLPLGNAPGGHGRFTGSISASDIKSQRGRPPITLDSLTSLMRVFGTYVDIHTARHASGELGNLVYSRR